MIAARGTCGAHRRGSVEYQPSRGSFSIDEVLKQFRWTATIFDVPAFSLGGFLAGPDNHVVDCTSHATTRRAPKNLKSISRRGWTSDVGSFTGQIATLVEEDRYGDRIGAKG
jgi:hypothetical protein